MSRLKYARDYNEGMSDAVNRFSTIISLLTASFALKILVKYPSVSQKLNSLTKFDLADDLVYSLDLLNFVLVLFVSLVNMGVQVFIF